MSDNNLTVIEKEPVANGTNNKLSIELPNDEKKELEVVLKNNQTVNQTTTSNQHKFGERVANTKKRIYRSTEEYHGTDCGCGDFRPEWLQRFRSPKMFLLIFSFLGILRAAYFTYTIACLSTIERRYAFPSKISAIILICDNISGLLLNPIVGYLGTRINGPKLIGAGCLLVGLSSIMSGTPYLVYGTSKSLLASSQSSPEISSFNSSAYLYTSLNGSEFNNNTKFEYCGLKKDDCIDKSSSFNIGAFLILAGASFLNGIGYSSFWTIGLPYLDDNAKKGTSPIYISVSTVIRMLGVSLGYFLSSFFLKFYENPFLSMNIKTNDPRWVGMWYGGFFLLGGLFLIFSIPIFFFPASMKKPKKKSKGTDDLSFKDALTILNRLVRNPILVFDAIGGGFRSIGFAGYWINKPRYIEAQFSMSASKSSFLTGATGITMKSIGILCGGIFMAKFKPKPKPLILMIITVELICNLIFFSAMFFGCKSPTFAHISYEKRSMVDLECNKDCQCTRQTFQPVCGSDNKTNYFSPCYAGCHPFNSYMNQTSKITTFENCGCDGETMTSGYCKPPKEEECNNLVWYLILMSTAGIVSSFARTPNVMIAIRSVDKEDKSFAFGIVGSFLSIFAYIPYPIIFGFVTDAACIIWENTCGKSGNCWIYDLDKLRVYLHSTAFGFLMVGALFDVLIYFYADRLNLYEEDDDDDFEPKKEIENTGNEKHEMVIHENKLEAIENCKKVSEC